MMTESLYNYELEENGYLFLYNAASDQLLALLPEIAELYKAGRKRPGLIAEKHADLFNELCSKGFFVPAGTDEPAAFIEKLKAQEARSEQFGIIVNPTLDCNLRCWYCYEEHHHDTVMPPAVGQALFRLIDRIAGDERYRHLHLSFFGGEPLLHYASTVRPLLEHARENCQRHNVSLSLHFTTNATLLDEALLSELAEYRTGFQITLDGNESVHNRVKHTSTGEPTYTAIVHNIRLAAQKGMPVTVRFNYTARFLPSFIDVLSAFKEAGEKARRYLSFDFQRVWQDCDGQPDEVQRQIEQLEAAFAEAGFQVNNAETYSTPFCYADSRNHVVVNYDGRLFKCTARDFTPERAEGQLSPEGGLCYNERHARRMDVRFGNAACRACRVFPLCHGGCSQMKLEYDGTGCLKGYSEERKEEMLRGRLLYVAEKAAEARRRAKQEKAGATGQPQTPAP